MSKEFYDKIDQLVSKMSASYNREQYIIPEYSGTLPNRDVIIEVSKLLRQLLFPGYFGQKSYEGETVEYHVGGLLTNIYKKLCKQINLH